MTILYSCNANYINQTMISMLSVIKQHPEGMDFILVSDGISDREKRQIKNLVEMTNQQRKDPTCCFKKKNQNSLKEDKVLSQVRFVELDSIPELKEMDTDGVHPKSIYAKLFPERLTDAERLLYLDSDVVANAPFSELFQMDLQGNVIAGVKMPYADSVLRRQQITGEIFLCDGVILMDVVQWKRQQLSKRAMEYIKRWQGKPERMSESVINFVCDRQILVLPPAYNQMPKFLVFGKKELEKMYQIIEYYSWEELKEAREHPVLIHFMNELYHRPWCRKSKNFMWNHPYRNNYIYYQKELGICQEERKSLSIRTKMTRYLYQMLPFSLFLWLFHKIHKD